MENQRESILNMAKGAIAERVDYEMGKVVDNILDINTRPDAKRKISITIELKPDQQRRVINVNTVAKATLVPTDPVSTSLYIAPDSNGELTITEITDQTPGQLNFDGQEQEQPKILKLAKQA